MKSFVDKDNKPVVPSYVHLPSYKAMLDAHKALQIGNRNKHGKGTDRKVNEMAREVRYTDINEVKHDLRKIGTLIGKANETRNKRQRADYLWDALNLLVSTYLTTRTVLDLKYMTDTRWSDFVLHAESLRRQLFGWYEYTLNKIEEERQGKSPDDEKDYELFYDIPAPPKVMLSQYAGSQTAGGPMGPDKVH